MKVLIILHLKMSSLIWDIRNKSNFLCYVCDIEYHVHNYSVFSRIIIIIINRHQLDLDRPVSTLSDSLFNSLHNLFYKKLKCSRYRPGAVQSVGRGIALLFHDRGTIKWWVVNSTLRPQFTPGKDPVPILQEASWAPGPVWTGGKSRPHRDSIPDRPSCSQ